MEDRYCNYENGFFGIGIENAKFDTNIGTLWRSAYNFGASFIFTIGAKYKKMASDTVKANMKMPLYNYQTIEDFVDNGIPQGTVLIGVENNLKKSKNLKSYDHPLKAIYLLGSEDNGLSNESIKLCKQFIQIETRVKCDKHGFIVKKNNCINVATAGSIIMWDRNCKIK